jgi:hypothetical protein
MGIYQCALRSISIAYRSNSIELLRKIIELLCVLRGEI